MTDICPDCGNGVLTAASGCTVVKILGKAELVEGIEYMTCDQCFFRWEEPDQKAKNEQTIDQIRKCLEWGT